MTAPLLPTIAGPTDLRRLSPEELPGLAQEIREAIIDQVMTTGGHLAPNLGVVELTMALHRVFNFEHDRLLFDVGHQCYPHKILTGRADRLSTLRQTGGMAGFPEPSESPFDLFSVGHAGTGISTAVGMARGDTLQGEGYHSENNPEGRRTVALVGDASIVNGLAMEGLNNAGTLDRQMLIVLNDNGMSISKPQGGFAKALDRVRMDGRYLDAKLRAKRMADAIPGGESLVRWYHKIGEVAKDLVAEDSWFADFGLLTVGPVDGHDLPKLESVLREVAKADRPIVLHVHTVKGKGFEHAEGNATKFHSPPAFQVKGCSVETVSKGRAFTAAFSDALASTMAEDDRVVACTAAMPDGTGITRILEEYPDRAWDVGICESHAMDMMAGLAKTGFRPFFAVYSTFLQRAFDQAFQEVSLQGLAVRLCLDRAGLVGGDGAVHHGFCDISLLRTLPNAALLAPIDEPSLKAAVAWMADYDDGLSAVRYPRGTVTERDLGPCPAFELGRSRPLFTPEHPVAAIVSYGTSGLDALEAAEALASEGMPVEVHDGRFAAPVDLQLLEDLARRELPVMTVEDHGLPGGFGAAIAEAASDAGLPLRLRRLGIPDHWIPCGSQSDQKKMAGIDADAIMTALRQLVANIPG